MMGQFQPSQTRMFWDSKPRSGKESTAKYIPLSTTFLGLFYLLTWNQNRRKWECNTGMHGLIRQKGTLL